MPEHCAACEPLADAIKRLGRHLSKVAERATPEALIDLHHTLYCMLCDDLPRPRKADGTFRPRNKR